MLNHSCFSAWISVDGQELPHYQTTVTTIVSMGLPATHKVSCWIASEEGKEFSIHVQTRPGMVPVGYPSRIGVSIRMDGATVTSRLLGRSSSKLDIYGVPVNDQTEKRFLFSKLPLTDDDSALRDISHLKDLGLISLKVERLLVSGYDCGFDYRNESVADKGPIHEASKKAGAHCVSFGKPTQFISKTRTIIKQLGSPLVIFEFRYRSANMLRAQGIMPQAISSEPIEDLTASHRQNRRLPESSADPSTSKRKVKQEADDEETVDAEIEALKDRLDVLERRRSKQNHSEGSVRPKKKVKVEPLDHSNFIDNEVNDLT